MRMIHFHLTHPRLAQPYPRFAAIFVFIVWFSLGERIPLRIPTIPEIDTSVNPGNQFKLRRDNKQFAPAYETKINK